VNHDERVALDRYALDTEAERSAANLQTVGQEWAQAKTDKDYAEADLKRISAEVNLAVRTADPQNYGLAKFTEDSISACVEASKEVQDAVKGVLNAKKEYNELDAVMTALKDKSDQIKNLTQLWIGGYFAEPTKKTGKYN